MTKYLNIEELTPAPERFLQFKGQEYPIVEQTVEGFIKNNQLLKELQALPEDDYSGHVKITVQMIRISVPDIQEDVLMGVPLSALRKIGAFVRGEDEIEEPAQESEPGKK